MFYTIQPIVPAHLRALAAIEAQVFPNEPWSEESLALLCGETACGFVALGANGVPLGYAGMTYAGDEGSVTNIAVLPAFRRRGIGLALTNALLSFCREKALSSLWLEVRASNTPAQALYDRLGFVTAGRRPHFYRHPTEDALCMCAALSV